MSVTHAWELPNPISAILFDCDGTLSTIEGINALADINGSKDIVQQLTDQAMGHTGMNPDIFQSRLNLVKPIRPDILALGQKYYQNRVPDVVETIQTFHNLGKDVYIISAGLLPAVAEFGRLLGIPDNRIFAVDVQFDANGTLIDFDQSSPLIHNDGKRLIINQLKKIHPNMLFIGDGLNDYAAHDLVTRFVGYGGAFYRTNIAAKCQYYITTLSMSPLLPLTLTAEEYQQLSKNDQSLYERGLDYINRGKVKV